MAVVERAYDTLRPGTDVDAYVIRKILGAGGFGVTYLAEHRRLGKEFAIKEFFPRAFAFRDGVTVNARTGGEETYSWGLDRFLQEARALAKFHHHAIVGVSNVFEANGTAYMVLSFEHGQDMRDWLAGLKRVPSQAELDSIVSPLLDALAILHSSGLLHRDIAPDNIFIRTDGTPVLLDFGAARSALSEHSAQMSAIVKTGYSPPEQYTTEGRDQGPWSDIYAFGATLYWAVTGELPPESTARTLTDRYVPAARKARGTFRQLFLTAIDDALKVSPDRRPRTIADWRPSLLAKDAAVDVAPPPPAPPPAVAQAFVATASAPAPAPDLAPATTVAPSPAAAPIVVEPRADAPIDLGPGVERKPSSAGRFARFLLKAVGIFVVLLGAVFVVGYCAGPNGRLSQSAPVNVATAVADCDRLASIPRDTAAKAPGVELAVLDAAAAVRTCSAAVSSADAAAAPRLRAQLGYALNAAGKVKEAAQALAAAASAGHPEAMAMHAEMMLEGVVPVGYDATTGCNLAERAMNAGSVQGRQLLGYCLASGIGGFQRDPARAAAHYREAAAKGHGLAMCFLGMMLRDGAGIPQDLGQARKLFEDADKNGDPRGTYLLASLYADGNGVTKDEARSVELYRRARSGLEKRATVNEVDSTRLVGIMLLRGEGGTQDVSRAVSLLEGAATRGSTPAMSALGRLYEAGSEVKQDYNTALRWLRSAAARDSESANNSLGTMYQAGRGVGRDYAEAMRYYQRAASLGHAEATYNVGEMYYYGRGVSEDFASALTWYRRAAALGSGSAMYSIGTMMASGRGADQSYVEAKRWYQKAVDVGDAQGTNAMGNLYRDGRGVRKDLAEAFKWYRKAADLGDADAMTSVGIAFRDGEGATQNLKVALDWFRRAADKNHTRGAHLTGVAYLMGRGVDVNYPEAHKWLKIAADQDWPAAVSDLGVMYHRGYGVAENPAEAFRLFSRAAELGDGTGMHNVAYMYELGRGVTKNCAQARAWYTKAIEAGYQESRKQLAELNKSKC